METEFRTQFLTRKSMMRGKAFQNRCECAGFDRTVGRNDLVMFASDLCCDANV